MNVFTRSSAATMSPLGAGGSPDPLASLPAVWQLAMLGS
jgi:hypothetical protein